MKKQVFLFLSYCIILLAIAGAVSAANPAINQVTQTVDDLANGNYVNGVEETKSAVTNLNVKSVGISQSNETKKVTSNGLTSTSKVYLRKLQSTGLNSANKMVYDQFVIYQRPAYNLKWCVYSFNRIVNPANPGVHGPEDNYRIFKLQNADLSKPNPSYLSYALMNVEDLTTSGNWEKAVQIRSKTDPLIGGMHGYEKHLSIKYYADNISVSPSVHRVIECDQLKIVVFSNLLDPRNIKNVIASTETVYLWNGQELYLNTTYKWKVSETVHTAYAAMFPVKRDASVSNIGQIDGLSNEILTLNRILILRGNSAKGTTWNNINNLKLSMEVLNPETALNNYNYNGDAENGKTYFNNIGSYNKLYITRVHSPCSELVTNTTVWQIQTVYKVWNDYTVPLTITSVKVTTNKLIKITFKSPIKFGINSSKILLDRMGKIIPITKNISGYTLLINTKSLLEIGKKYSLNLHYNSINDLKGHVLVKNYSFELIYDITAPNIIAVNPHNNGVKIAVNKIIRVAFSEQIKFGTKYLTLTNSRGVLIPLEISINGVVMSIIPKILLEDGTNYTLILHTSCIKDLAGNALKKVYTTNFTTEKSSN